MISYVSVFKALWWQSTKISNWCRSLTTGILVSALIDMEPFSNFIVSLWLLCVTSCINGNNLIPDDGAARQESARQLTCPTLGSAAFLLFIDVWIENLIFVTHHRVLSIQPAESSVQVSSGCCVRRRVPKSGSDSVRGIYYNYNISVPGPWNQRQEYIAQVEILEILSTRRAISFHLINFNLLSEIFHIKAHEYEISTAPSKYTRKYYNLLFIFIFHVLKILKLNCMQQSK